MIAATCVILFFGENGCVKMVALDKENSKCMMDQNLLSVKTFVQLMITDIINENEGFTREFRRSLEFVQNNVQEVKNEVAQMKNLDTNNYSQYMYFQYMLRPIKRCTT